MSAVYRWCPIRQAHVPTTPGRIRVDVDSARLAELLERHGPALRAAVRRESARIITEMLAETLPLQAARYRKIGTLR